VDFVKLRPASPQGAQNTINLIAHFSCFTPAIGQYCYPLDTQLLATETVLKQTEMIANELAVVV